MFNVHLALGVGNEAAHLDDAMTNAVKKLFELAEEKAEELGLRRDYVPLTYADAWQKPIQRRDNAAIEELLEISKRYDPEGMFQKQVQGGFKLRYQEA